MTSWQLRKNMTYQLSMMGSTRRGRIAAALEGDLLELYLQLVAKQSDATTHADWDALDSTVQNLKRVRSLSRIRRETRLAYVMTLVGINHNPSLASRAVAALLVDHWCDPVACARLQHDALRYSAIASLTPEVIASSDKDTIADMVEYGARAALDGDGLDSTGVLRRDWDSSRDIVFEGGASSLEEELCTLAQRCRSALNSSRARLIVKKYLTSKGLGTFLGDFLDWGVHQLRRLPPNSMEQALENGEISGCDGSASVDVGSKDTGAAAAEEHPPHLPPAMLQAARAATAARAVITTAPLPGAANHRTAKTYNFFLGSSRKRPRNTPTEAYGKRDAQGSNGVGEPLRNDSGSEVLLERVAVETRAAAATSSLQVSASAFTENPSEAQSRSPSMSSTVSPVLHEAPGQALAPPPSAADVKELTERYRQQRLSALQMVFLGHQVYDSTSSTSPSPRLHSPRFPRTSALSRRQASLQSNGDRSRESGRGARHRSGLSEIEYLASEKRSKEVGELAASSALPSSAQHPACGDDLLGSDKGERRRNGQGTESPATVEVRGVAVESTRRKLRGFTGASSTDINADRDVRDDAGSCLLRGRARRSGGFPGVRGGVARQGDPGSSDQNGHAVRDKGDKTRCPAELSCGDQIVFKKTSATSVTGRGRWVRGVIRVDHGDGRYDAYLADGQTALMVRRADLHICDESSRPPSDCPAAVFHCPSLVNLPPPEDDVRREAWVCSRELRGVGGCDEETDEESTVKCATTQTKEVMGGTQDARDRDVGHETGEEVGVVWNVQQQQRLEASEEDDTGSESVSDGKGGSGGRDVQRANGSRSTANVTEKKGEGSEKVRVPVTTSRAAGKGEGGLTVCLRSVGPVHCKGLPLGRGSSKHGALQRKVRRGKRGGGGDAGDLDSSESERVGTQNGMASDTRMAYTREVAYLRDADKGGRGASSGKRTVLGMSSTTPKAGMGESMRTTRSGRMHGPGQHKGVIEGGRSGPLVSNGYVAGDGHEPHDRRQRTNNVMIDVHGSLVDNSVPDEPIVGEPACGARVELSMPNRPGTVRSSVPNGTDAGGSAASGSDTGGCIAASPATANVTADARLLSPNSTNLSGFRTVSNPKRTYRGKAWRAGRAKGEAWKVGQTRSHARRASGVDSQARGRRSRQSQDEKIPSDDEIAAHLEPAIDDIYQHAGPGHAAVGGMDHHITSSSSDDDAVDLVGKRHVTRRMEMRPRRRAW